MCESAIMLILCRVTPYNDTAAVARASQEEEEEVQVRVEPAALTGFSSLDVSVIMGPDYVILRTLQSQ